MADLFDSIASPRANASGNASTKHCSATANDDPERVEWHKELIGALIMRRQYPCCLGC